MSDGYGKMGKCCLCERLYTGYGHNPDPLGDVMSERCCDDCNYMYILAARGLGQIDVDTAPTNVLHRLVKAQRTTKK